MSFPLHSIAPTYEMLIITFYRGTKNKQRVMKIRKKFKKCPEDCCIYSENLD